MVWHLLLNSVIKIVLVPVGVADVVTSCTSPWIPIVNSCKQANEPVNFEQLEKRLIISETSLVPSSSTQSIRFPRGVGNKGVWICQTSSYTSYSGTPSWRAFITAYAPNSAIREPWHSFVNVKVIFQNTRRIKSFFPYKDRLNRSQLSKVIYKASCWDCNDFYIGKRKQRLQQHFKALSKHDHSSAIADHVKTTGHNIKWDHFDILASGKTDYHCKIKETLFIQELQPALNANVSSEKLLLY